MGSYIVTGAGFMDWIRNSGSSILNVVLLAVGIVLIIRAFMDVGGALGKGNKEWGKAGIGLAVGLIGALLLGFNAQGAMSFFSGKKDVIPTD